MRKLLSIIILSILFSFSFAYEVQDYRIFIAGKNNFLEGDYDKAKLNFDFLVRNYPTSLLFTNKYAYYYMGMNYYYLKDYNKAIYYLEQAIYAPKEFQDNGYFKTKRKNFFEYERNYYLADIYFHLGEEDKAIKHLKFLIKDYYSYTLSEYESKALKRLAIIDPYYQTLYEVKYGNKTNLLSSLEKEDLRVTADYFLSKGLFNSAITAYKLILEGSTDDEVRTNLLEALTRNKNYDEVVEIATTYLEENPKGDYYYYRGNAFRRIGRLDYAILDFKRVVHGKFVRTSKYETARLYYIQKKYSMAISILKTLADKRSHTLLIDSYLAANKDSKFTELATDYIEKYPSSNEAAYYRFLLYKSTGNIDYLTWIKKYNLNTFYYEKALAINSTTYKFPEYPINSKLARYKDTIGPLEKLSKLGDHEILKMNFENLNLPSEEKVLQGYIISRVYENGDFFHQAIKNSRRYQKETSQYSNLLDLLYPRYYSNIVERAALNHNVESALIYAVILKESLFSDDIVSRAGAYGLMQLILPTAQGMEATVSPEDLMDPNININLGTRYLQILLKRYKGDVTKTIAAYNGGMGNVDKWTRGGILDIEAIPFPETKAYTKNVLSSYYKYKRLYD